MGIYNILLIKEDYCSEQNWNVLTCDMQSPRIVARKALTVALTYNLAPRESIAP